MTGRLFKISFFIPFPVAQLRGVKTKVYQCISNNLMAEYTLVFNNFEDAFEWAERARGKYVESDSMFTIEEKKN